MIQIHYTIGEVMSSLAMIESPSRTAIVGSKPPPYTDTEPDAPLEKEPLMVAEDADVEVTVIDHKPITAKIRTTIHHLHRVGGFRARWRGVGISAIYHFLHGMAANVLAAFFGFGLIGEALCYVLVSLGLARVHMAWTHAMIGQPSSKSWLRRMPARKDCRRILLPTLVYALAQQATIILPIGVAFFMGVTPPQLHGIKDTMHHGCPKQMASIALRMLAVPLTYAIVGLAVLLPASVTLTRIEATLLPEGEEAIVSFDKEAIVGDIDVVAKGGSRALFVQAWRSFDRSARLRLIKLYAKMVMAQVFTAFLAMHLMVAEMYVIGGERLALFARSAAAQLKLAAIEGQKAAREGAN